MKLSFKESYEKAKKYISPALLILLPICIFYGMEFFLCNPLERQTLPIQLLNIFFFELFTFLGLFILKKGKYILRLEAVIFGIMGLLNYYMLSFRGTPFMPWDFFSLKTAASVADNFDYSLEAGALLLIPVFIGFFLLSGLCDITVDSRKKRLSGSLIFLVFMAGYVCYVQSPHALKTFGLYDKLFTPTTMTYRDGTVVTLIMQAQYLDVEKPQGYDPEDTAALLARYEDTPPTSGISTNGKDSQASDEPTKGMDSQTSGDYPNIIVIMNEAFSDLNVLGDFSTNEDYMPFVHSLLKGHENTQSGYLHVSILGGNTANSEFEFLTSQTLAFLPHGSVPYQQYIKGNTFSLASHLKSLGYSTVAVHPYGAKGWQRHEVYPWLGFDDFISVEDFENPSLIRKYVSDEENYERIKEIYENKKADSPLFLFNVTMQNHSSYSESFANFQPTIQVSDSDSLSLSNYLSLLKISDQEISELVSFFAKEEEKTLLLFFGDHQPANSVVSDIWTLNGKDPSSLTLEDQKLRYQVPFFLWANYDIQEETGMETSLNHLAPLILDAGRLPSSPFYNFLSAQAKKYPVISAIHAVDQSGKSYEIKELEEPLREYSMLQYYYLFDNRNKPY